MYNYPLFIVTGGSGSGKTSISIELGKVLTEHGVLDMDFLVVDNDFGIASNNSLMIAKFNALCEKGTVLFGNVPYSYDITKSELFSYFTNVHFIYLYCRTKERIKRLKEREVWSDENIIHELSLANHMLQEYKNRDSSALILDTTSSSPEDIAIKLKLYILEKT